MLASELGGLSTSDSARVRWDLEGSSWAVTSLGLGQAQSRGRAVHFTDGHTGDWSLDRPRPDRATVGVRLAAAAAGPPSGLRQ